MNTPVSFELAKLLKEKGIDDESANYYNEKGELLFDVDFPSLQPTKPHIYYSAPTIADVVMWLYKKHGIWIQPFPYDTITAAKEWTVTILSLEWGEDKEVHYEYKIGSCNSPTEAYEAGIEYVLNNLI